MGDCKYLEKLVSFTVCSVSKDENLNGSISNSMNGLIFKGLGGGFETSRYQKNHFQNHCLRSSSPFSISCRNIWSITEKADFNSRISLTHSFLSSKRETNQNKNKN